MKTPPKKTQKPSEPAIKRRRYDSPVRRQQSADTLERILAIGAELVRGLLAWDLNNLTASGIAERIGVSERTVKRYFPTDRKLHDAVMQRLVQESGISLAQLKLDEFETVTARMFQYLASFSVTASTLPAQDSTFATMDRDRCEAVLRAVTQAAPELSEQERKAAAAALDLLWSVPSYERMTLSWGLQSADATATLTWMISLVKDALQQGRAPEIDG